MFSFNIGTEMEGSTFNLILYSNVQIAITSALEPDGIATENRAMRGEKEKGCGEQDVEHPVTAAAAKVINCKMAKCIIYR